VPAAIGDRAERIIRRVQKRQEKDVQWRSEGGSLTHVNLGPLNLPWRSWIDAGKSVLVLARHRRGAQDISTDLAQIAIPHSLGGYSLHNSTEAKAIRDFILMRRGEALPWRKVAKMFEVLGMVEFYEDIRSRGAHERDMMLDRNSALIKWSRWDDPEWPLLFAQSRQDLKRVRQIERIMQREGLEVVGRDPQVNVMTMHAAKGREADIVIISPDCNETVRKNLMTPSEIRLAYVALTRAKERAIVLAPRSARWIGHLTGA
jgi:superfamily I DNA/RNA helicase